MREHVGIRVKGKMATRENCFSLAQQESHVRPSPKLATPPGGALVAFCPQVPARAIALCQRILPADVVEAGWLATASVIPLLFNPLEANAFELPKAAALRAIVLVMGLAALMRTADLGHGKFRTDRGFVVAAVAFGATLALSTLLSTYPLTSLFGSYPRQQGLLTLVSYPALGIMVALSLRRRTQATRLWRVLVWGSVPIMTYALIQFLGLDPFDWQSDSGSPIVSTLGRSNFVGTYLVMILPLTAAYTAVSSRKPIYGMLVAAQLFCLVVTQARSAWIGVLGAGTIMILTWAQVMHVRRIVHGVPWLLGCAVLIIALSSLWASRMQSPRAEPIVNWADLFTGSTAARLTIWQSTLSLLGERRWLGYGPETMHVAFARVFPPQLVYYQGKQFAVDRAHNLWLDLAMSGGLLAVGTFGVLLLVIARRMASRLHTLVDRRDRWLMIALAGSLAGHLIDLQFAFDVTATAAVFWLLLALGVALALGWESPVAPAPRSSMRERWLWAFPALGAALVVGALSVRPVLADMAYRTSEIDTNPVAQRMAAGEQAVDLWSLEPEYQLGLARLSASVGASASTEVALRAATLLDPDNPRVWATRGDIYVLWSRQNAAFYTHAEDAYRHAIDLAPNIATYHAVLGWTLAKQQKRDDAVAALERATALDATDASAFQLLGDLYWDVGRTSDATQAWKEAVRWSKH